MTQILLFSILSIALILLVILTIVDLRHRLLPNIYVFPFFLLGIAFHATIGITPDIALSMVTGTLAGGGLLYAIRLIANRIYQQDTLGLGDVKLMAAAGTWLGIEHIFMALGIGAFLGLLHGLAYVAIHYIRTKERLALSRLSIPAGPGFIGGIILTGLIKFYWTY
jgi:prepilin signal peptidase PulO-like enzyme (type II secretory pathway)